MHTNLNFSLLHVIFTVWSRVVLSAKQIPFFPASGLLTNSNCFKKQQNHRNSLL